MSDSSHVGAKASEEESSHSSLDCVFELHVAENKSNVGFVQVRAILCFHDLQLHPI